jgi:predicted TIM-barrel fold metal-dependent hydrolase
VIHLRTRSTQPYGRDDAQLFLDKILPAAPDSVIQIAHLAGSGPGYPDNADAALRVFADAIAAGDPRTRNLIFDVTTVVTDTTDAATAALIAQRLRQLGLRRILFGSDLPLGGNPAPREAWQIFSMKLPLTRTEYATIATNVAPYLR